MTLSVVISGSYKRDFPRLRNAYKELVEQGCQVLSPMNINPVAEANGFVYMEGQEQGDPHDIESNHLKCIAQANFLWLHNPEGYVGTSATLEIGYATSLGIPIYCQVEPTEPILKPFVRVCLSPSHAVNLYTLFGNTPVPAIASFQTYYKRAAEQRAYEFDPQDALLLMVEEVGELAKAIRKGTDIPRYGDRPITVDPEEELADTFLFVIHIANILKSDLGTAVQKKERLNWNRFFQSTVKAPETIVGHGG